MSRLQIKMPEVFSYSTRVPMRVGDINRGQHVGHLAVLSMIEEARARFWRRCGYPERANSSGTSGFIIADLAVVYLRQVNYGKPLLFEIAVGDFSAKGYAIFYRVLDAEGKEMARAKTGIVVFDYRRQEASALSVAMKEKLSRNYLR